MKIKNNANPFNLEATLCCGQVFRWEKRDDWWYGVVRDKVFKIRQRDTELEFVNADEEFVKNYFGLHDDLQAIAEQIGKDKQIKKALDKYWGLRIVRQDPWECFISYICATCKGIAAIKRMLLELSQKFGEKMTFDGYTFFAFPLPEKLAKARLADLSECGLGYRARYVSETAKTIYENNFDLERLRKLTYEKARKELIKFLGVGLKVADCVLLFSLGKFEAFPVDVWVKRAILEYYAEHFPVDFINKVLNQESLSNSEYEKLSAFGRNYFGEYAGYAQEYLYHHERMQH